MSILVNKSNIISKTIPNLLNNGHYVVRKLTKLSDMGIEWKRPVKIPYTSAERSGDLGLDIEVKPTEYCSTYKKSTELPKADEKIKKLFTVRFHTQEEANLLRLEKILELVKSHEHDESSPEVIIAQLTHRIHILQEYMSKSPTDSKARERLKEIIEKRTKLLKELRISDYKKFEWILEKLNLIYKPLPLHDIKPQRKLSLRKLTDKRCQEIIQEKFDNYKAFLESQKKDFYKEKAEKYARIRQEELELGLNPTITEEEVECARKQAAAYQ